MDSANPKWCSGKEPPLPMQEMQEMHVSLDWKDPWMKKWQLTPVFLPGNSMDRGTWQATVRGVTREWGKI